MKHFIVSLALVFSVSAFAEDETPITPDDYRVFCGYLDALEKPELAKLSEKRRDRKIARMAKMKVKKLKASVASSKRYGATCAEVGKVFKESAEKAVRAKMGKRIDMFVFDDSDPSHIVVSVRWLAGDRKKLVQEGVLIAKLIADASPLAKTVAVRAVNPSAPDRKADEAVWFEARMTASRASSIDEAKISDFADRRYIRLLDGVKCAAPLQAETLLGYRGGPCEKKDAAPAE